ncbi:ATP-binding protein [bacterium]|nr:ATP-binding protein [bacterium]
MVILNRNILNIIKNSSKSLLLLGPRQTGKSTLLRALHPELVIDLADEREFLSFARNPGEIFARVEGRGLRTILIDEVQRIPSLLNSIQSLLDKDKSLRFFLSGSSARKMARGQANLLPGRVISLKLGPLVAAELDYRLNEGRALGTGTLPGIYLDESQSDRLAVLDSYAATYVREEVQAEALTRNLEGFSRFLFVAASRATDFLDYAKLANTSSITRQSAIRFFEILEETLIVHRCDAFAKSGKRRLVQHPRYFFFDNGVLNALLGNYTVSDDRIGMLFENLVYTQLLNSANATGKRIRITNYRTEHGAEVDFVCELEGEVWAIEAKASRNIGRDDISGLKSFADFYKKPHRAVVAYMGAHAKRIDGVDVLPWQDLLRAMKI